MSAQSIQDPQTVEVIRTLRALAEAGVLRRLDAEFAAWLCELDPGAQPALPIVAAVLCQMEGQGHTCLPLAAIESSEPLLRPRSPETGVLIDQLFGRLPRNLADCSITLAQSLTVQRVAPDHPVSSSPNEPDTPLVLDGPDDAPRLYLRRYWRDERAVARAVQARSLMRDPVDELRVGAALNRLFGPIETHPNPVDWQRIACALALRGRLTLITGGPGTGKTYTAARLLALLFAMHLDEAPLRIALAAPTGKAAARLRQSIDGSLQQLQAALGEPADPTIDLAALTQAIGPARTLHALLGSRADTRQFRHHAQNPLDLDVVIVDEASMIHLEMMAALMAALPSTTRLILLGDKDQLASVEAGAVLGDLCAGAQLVRYDDETRRYLHATTGQAIDASTLKSSETQTPPAITSQTAMLRESRRFDGPIGELASAVNEGGDPERAAELLRSGTGGALWLTENGAIGAATELAMTGRQGAPSCYGDYLRIMQAAPTPGDRVAHERWAIEVLQAFDRFRVLCAVREGDWGTSGLNRSIERGLAQAGWIDPIGPWYAGRPVMITRNDPALGVFNGDVGLTLRSAEDPERLRVYFLDGTRLRSVSVIRLVHVETAFALTVHKSQGSEFDHTMLVLAAQSGGVLTRELLYTAITRARRAFSLVAASPDLLQNGIRRPTRRASGLMMQG